MDKETSNYIVKYYSGLLSADEKLAIRHTTSIYKRGKEDSENPMVLKIYRDRGWLTTDQKILDLLKDGYDDFERKIAQRILEEFPQRVFLNKCTRCNKLARTPYARQCRHCAHNWHDSVVAKIKITDCLQISERPFFFLFGEFIEGKVEFGDRIDLVPLGLAMQPEIKALEFVRKNSAGSVWEAIALGFDEPEEAEKRLLKADKNKGQKIEILRKR